MSRLSSAAPQIGAALGAGLMILSAIAFQAGARSEDRQDNVENRSPLGDEAALPASQPQSGAGDIEWAANALRSVTEEPAAQDSGVVAALEENPARAPQLAVIIDDIMDVATAERIWSLDIPITVSVLPYANDASVISDRAQGREVFLHLPMEPVGLEDPGPYALTKSMAGETRAARVRWALSQVPAASGFNNHMGSRLTADRDAMVEIFSALDGAQDQLLFVDSLTHPRSVAREAAVSEGFTAFDRDIFLDHEADASAIEAQLDLALQRAINEGQAIAIGHPYPDTLAVLETLAAKARAQGVAIVPVSALVAD
ncbi:divergent polysaccharide deacetylase family protein [Maricaulaceae bacterium EIL42A08]|nr:divergent polysaccharide deacetylase family protein [Maricaulaceae bacterium EIL42A08]